MLPLLALPAYGVLPDLSKPVVYEVNLRALGPKGGFRELTRRLDGLAKLGTNVVWLMPIYPVGRVRSAGGLGSPYAVADYDRVNPEFGTAEEFRSLVKRAHVLKMRVILDWVANHTSWDHPWLKDKDWYSQDGKGDIIIPPGTNWQDAAELNFESVPMRKAMIASMEGWVRHYDIDGFRCDAADFVPADFWKQAIASLRKGSEKPLLFLAEGSKKEEFEAGFDLMYGWDFYYNLKAVFNENRSAKTVAEVSRKEYEMVPEGKERLRYTANHDETAWTDSSITIFKGQEGALAAFTITALAGGAQLLYTGQEIGWHDKIPFFDRSDVGGTGHPGTFEAFKRVLSLRRDDFEPLQDWSTDDVVAYTRTAPKRAISVIVNVRPNVQNINIPEDWQREVRDLLTGRVFKAEPQATLAPYERRVLERVRP